MIGIGWKRRRLNRDEKRDERGEVMQLEPTAEWCQNLKTQAKGWKMKAKIEELLKSNGWQRTGQSLISPSNLFFSRPGVDDKISAILTNFGFICYSENAPPFEAIRHYSYEE